MPEPPSADPIRVLVAYQHHGPAGGGPPSLVSEAKAALGGLRIRGRPVEAFILAETALTADDHYMKAFEREAVDSDYLVALAFEDTRPASMAGNLWLEVGYWLARRGRETALLARCSDNVAAPSNIAGVPFHRVYRASEVKALVEAAVRDNPVLAPARRKLLDEAHRRIFERAGRSHGVETEAERIVIARPTGPLPTGQELLCRVDVTRTGVVLSERLRVGVEIAGRALRSDGPINYLWSFGRGQMPHETWSVLCSQLDAARPQTGAFVRLFRLRAASLTEEDGTEHPFDPAGCRATKLDGRIFFDFDVPDACKARPVAMALELDATLPLGQGWYRYFAARPVWRRLEIELSCPLSFTVLQSFSVARVTSRPPSPQDHVPHAAIEAEGPVLPGDHVDFVFGPREEERMEKKKAPAKKAPAKKPAAKKAPAKKPAAKKAPAKKPAAKKPAAKKPAAKKAPAKKPAAKKAPAKKPAAKKKAPKKKSAPPSPAPVKRNGGGGTDRDGGGGLGG